MRMLHDPAIRSSLEERLKALSPDAPRKWGSMTPDQMLWHLNQFLEFALGKGERREGKRPPIPLPIMRFLLLNMPWPKSAPTHPGALAKDRYDFAAERERCLALIDSFVRRPLDGPWPVDAAFGEVTGLFTSRLQAKHLDHHLRQFNA
ncbi:MAG: DinB family protein [Gemmatimonadota bacterium]